MKRAVVFLICCMITAISVITVFADHTRVVDLTKEELYNRLWRGIEDEITDSSQEKTSFFNLFLLSLYHNEYDKFINGYEVFYDDTVADVGGKFFEYFDTVYSDSLEIELQGSDVAVMSHYDPSNPNRKLYWTYDSSTDKYVAKDGNGKVITGIDRYPVEIAETEQTTVSTQSEQTTTVQSHSDGKSVYPKSDTAESTQPTTETAVAGQSDESTFHTVWIITGVLIIAGTLLFMLNKRKGH